MGDVFHIIKNGIVYELEPDEGEGFIINIPALPGCISMGHTIDEALAMIADAMAGWISVAREQGFPVPEQFADLQKAS